MMWQARPHLGGCAAADGQRVRRGGPHHVEVHHDVRPGRYCSCPPRHQTYRDPSFPELNGMASYDMDSNVGQA